MGHKHLHELLSEDQEPFQLKNYIADRRCQLKSATPYSAGETALKPRKRKPLIQSTSASTTARNFCINHVCLFSFHDSPDVRRSPFLEFPSPAIKSPYNNNGKTPNNATVFLHIPSRTAAMLLDAAIRIQKQKQPTHKHKPKYESSRNAGFGLFGSLFKRLKDRRTRIKHREISLSSPPTSRNLKRDSDLDVAGNNSRLTSPDWSEKLSDLETSCSSWSVHDEFMSENCFCSSPFRFSLERSPSSGHRTPDFVSPETTPTHHLQQETCQEIHLEEEDKEQCSPVSVLDPLYEEDEEEHDGVAMEEDGYDIECSFANVQRAKHQLLQKLHRFEKLAKLDPIELEKHMLEQYCQEEDSSNEMVLRDIFNVLGGGKVPTHVKRIVSDLVAEENKNEEERGVVVRRVLSRLESWEMVESNTIDMMVELEFRKEKGEGWRRYDEVKIKEIGMEIEVAIFGGFVEELTQELLIVSGD
ncbi:uncharacterized protein LOC112526290 [Cynara cardunculus var. scolymus]|uniref:uncharacterized protein LOC112526290 n=1 Tax=Cynara cardunculus var. scolymus TaxID=59895 RepID=UPI000D624F2C|nr:uncharacterized protein LOC112526290 [Cynara cardunculus var. scolymus]